MKKTKEAVYRETNNELGKGNPLIESLPDLLEEEIVIRKTRFNLNITDEQREDSARERCMMVPNLKYVFYPLNEHIEIYYTIMGMIISGYISRNPIEYENLKMIRGDVGPYIESSHFSSTALIGISGTGKTTTVEKILSLIPQVQVHKNYRGIKFYATQVNWLKVDCPFNSGMGGFCREIFRSLDDLLGTDYLRDLGGHLASVSSMVNSIAKIFADINLGLLVTDEFQHILARSWKKELNNFLTSFSNITKVPIFIIGTPKAEAAFDEAFRATRRYVDDGAYYWNRILSFDDPKWKEWFSWLFEFQYTRTPTELTDEISKKFYDYSQGIFSIANSLFRKVQNYVISNPMDEKEIITPEIIDYVFKAYYKPLVRVIEAISNNDYEELESLEDLLIKIEQTSFNHQKVKVVNATETIDNQVRAARITRESLKGEMIGILEAMELPLSKADIQDLVEDVIDSNPGVKEGRLRTIIMQRALKKESIKKEDKPKHDFSTVLGQKEEAIGFIE